VGRLHGHWPDPLGSPRVVCPVADTLDVNAQLDESARRFEDGDYQVALACADRAARLLPDSVEAHHNRALALGALDRIDEAKQAYTLALALDPDDPETLAGAAHFYINRLKPDRELTLIGLEYARRGSSRVGRRRDDRELASRLALLEAQALNYLGRADEALARVESSIELDPSKIDARFELAMTLFNLCRLDRAKQTFSEVLASAPDDADAHHYLGLIFEAQGRASDAELHFARARALAPDRFQAPILLGPAEFKAAVDHAIGQLDPTNRALLAQVKLELADLPALADLTAVDPPFPPTILGLYRGAPLQDRVGGHAHAPPGDPSDPRSIVLYRKNLARAVSSRAELEEQVRMTLWHEIGHLRGEDEDDLRERGLE
jgi:Flp pilus assembly protein TadD